MHFRIRCTVDGLIERVFNESIAYDHLGDTVTHVAIEKSEAMRGDKKWPVVLVNCATEQDLEPSDGLADLIKAISTSKDGVSINLEKIDDQAKPLFAVVDPFFAKLREDMERTTMLLNWRYGITDKPLKSFTDRAESVSLDGSEWRNISTIRGIKLIFTGSYRKNETTVADDIRSLFDAGLEAPLALQLLVEAKSQTRTYPRSALVIGVTAAEIAIKQLVGELAPDTRWLLENLPSPPIFKIARDYIPTLKVKHILWTKA